MDGGILEKLCEEIAEGVEEKVIGKVVAVIGKALEEAASPPLAYREEKAAEMLGMSVAALIKKRNNKEINYHKDGRIISYTPEDLREYLDRIAHKVVPKANTKSNLMLVGSATANGRAAKRAIAG